jgi:hypothetical protein
MSVLRESRVKDQTTIYDHFGQRLFTVDTWIWQTAVARGDAQKWLRPGPDDDDAPPPPPPPPDPDHQPLVPGPPGDPF